MPETSPNKLSDPLGELEIEKKKLEIEKLRAENAKLEVEYKELNKPWYAKPQWWSVLVPFLIGAGTILIAFLTGIISVERLKQEKESLAETITLQKDSIRYFSLYAKGQKDSLLKRIKFEQVGIKKLQHFSDSLKFLNLNQRKLIAMNDSQELDRINSAIYMYEDHHGLYRQLDEVLEDTTSKYERQKKLEELRMARKAVLRKLKRPQRATEANNW